MPDDLGLPLSRYHCPICPWTLDEPVPDDDPAATGAAIARTLATLERIGVVHTPLEEATETRQERINRAAATHMVAQMQPVERALKVHLESHRLEEWVSAASKLFTLRQNVGVLADVAPPDSERVFAAIYTGELTVNDGRWIRIATGIIDALKEKADG